ncbi:MAG: AEC family transporter [Oscillospiraceae bacterium]|nr:AEC family transporter [Oscillospiraceae bacterium]
MNLGLILITAVNAILPILLLILLGYILKKVGFLNDNFLAVGNKLVFNICLPAMLFINIYDIEGFSAIQWDVVIYSVAAVCLLFALSFLPALTSTKDPLRKGVVMQCVYRSNYAIIGIPLATALGGAQAAAVTAVISAFSIPVFNTFAVISLTIFKKDSHAKKVDIGGILRNIVKNPLIIGVALGLICLGIRQAQLEIWGQIVFAMNRQIKFLYTVLNSLKGITTPLALIVLGGQFEFSAVKGMFREIAAGTLWRTVLAPLIGLGLAVILSSYTRLLHCGPNEYPALIALFGSPVAVSSAVMAAGMKNDGQLAAQLVVWTSIVSIFTIFATICIMMPMGLLTP